MTGLLRTVTPAEVRALRAQPVSSEALGVAGSIVEDVRERGETALREYAQRFDGLASDAPLFLDRADLEAARAELEEREPKTVRLLERTANRIRRFADAQRESLAPLDAAVPGGRAGHDLVPVGSAGCYAPGGRFPLPSSVLMTAVTARAAGVERVVIASPNPGLLVRATAAVAGADALLCAGGAQAIAAFAYGAGDLEPVDFVCGPGNRYVTAAKQLVFGAVGVDMLAGPSELVVLADDTTDPAIVAADLLGQAEHDPDALPVLVTTDAILPDRVRAELEAQLPALGETCATESLRAGFAVVCAGEDEALEVVARLAPEHLEVMAPSIDRAKLRRVHAGALFLGAVSAEVFGDYGAGPNHTLPTGGGSRFRGGLGVLDFLRVRTWLELDPDAAELEDLRRDATALAQLEGLDAHAASAERRASPR